MLSYSPLCSFIVVSSCNIYVFLLVFTHGKHVLVNLLISRILEQVNVAIGSRALFFQLGVILNWPCSTLECSNLYFESFCSYFRPTCLSHTTWSITERANKVGQNFEQVEPTCSFVRITAEIIRHFKSAKETGPN